MHKFLIIAATKELTTLKINSMMKFAITCHVLFMATGTFAQPGSADQEVLMVNSTVPLIEARATELPDIITLEDEYTLLLGNSEDEMSVGIGSDYPSSLASLELGDSDKGFLVNRMTEYQATIFEMSLGIAEEGMMIYNIDKGNLQIWNGTRWIPAGEGKLSLDEHELKINDSKTVDLSKYADNTDQQQLTNASLDGKTLTIGIENGNDISVDLSPIFAEYEARLVELENRMATSEPLKPAVLDLANQAMLYQNTPNPISSRSTIKYFIPEEAKSAELVISNSMGQVLVRKNLSLRGGTGLELFDAGELSTGIYYCMLYVDDQKIDTKKMMVE
ncbi:MAG: hypothetical protein ACI837_002413 [Crocinitomicaceae bacterium]|jgi:hypothetical protein